MSSIVTQEAKTAVAKNFTDIYSAGKSLYLALSRTTAWADDNNPPVPTGTASDITAFWSEIIAIQKVPTANYALVARRLTWLSAETYVAFADDYGTDFYVINSESNVYQCITAGGGTSTNEPTGHNNGADQTLADGYVWRYLFGLNTDDLVNDLQTDLWIPVPYGAKMSADQTSYGSTTPDKILGAQHVLIKAEANDASFPLGNFRQIGLIDTPLLSNETPVLSDFSLPGALTSGSGYLQTIENVSPVLRIATQTETFKIIQRFF